MRHNSLAVLIRAALTFSLAILFATSVQAQMFGIPPAEKGNPAWNEVSELVPQDEPILCLMWNEAGALNAKGNPSDQWFADAGLQESMGKLKKAIARVTEEQGTPAAAEFAKDIAWKLLAKAGAVVVEKIDTEEQTANASLIVRLGEDKEAIAAFLDTLMTELDVTANIVDEESVYTLPDTPFPVLVGVHSGHLIAAVGNGQWKTIIDRIDDKKETPDWLKKRLSTLPITRRGQFIFGSISAVMEALPLEAKENPEFQRIREALVLDGLKTISASAGTDSISNVSLFHFECEKEGLASIFDVTPIKSEKLNQLPADAISAVAMRFSPETVMQLVKAIVPPEQLEEAMLAFSEESGLDLEKDIVDHLEGTIRYYNSGVVINPKQVGIIKINDELKFRDSFDQINEVIEGLANERGLEFTEKEKNGLSVFGVKNFGLSLYWAVHKGELYIANNSRAIGSHIRKYAKGAKPSLLDGELAAKILSESKMMRLEGPIAIQHYDLDQIIEVVVPLIQSAFAFIPPQASQNFDFGADDFPPMESLLGLRSSHSMLFKSPEGYTGISRYDTPAPLEVTTLAGSGIAIGMLLPAVQTTREAARRTASMNNQRQLALALLNYESANGSFPPAYSVDDDGNPLLSWRVAILPYLEQQALYDKFNHDEPWDSENNIALLEQMPNVFRNPSAIGRPGQTDYVAPTSDDSILALDGGVTFADITDGSSNTVLLMEVGMDQQVPWSSPQDIKIDNLGSLDIENGHPGTVICTLCDGSVHSIPKTTSVEEFISGCKKSDGIGVEALGIE